MNSLQAATLALSMLGVSVMPPVLAGEDSHPHHWNYGGSANPSQWGRLGHDFALCEVGRDQSPIDIDNAVTGTPSDLRFSYTDVPLVVVNNGHTVQVNIEAGNSITISGDTYDLLQLHFHTPSEHTTAGLATAMELHLVHRNDAGELAVLGVMMEAGEPHPVIESIWENIPEATEINAVDLTINAADLLPDSVTYYSYAGSLTTPPCSEGVRWNVLAEPIQVSEEQIETFLDLYQVNARPIQPTNGRIIERHDQRLFLN